MSLPLPSGASLTHATHSAPTTKAIGDKFRRNPSMPQTSSDQHASAATAAAASAAPSPAVHLANFGSARSALSAASSHALEAPTLPRERITAESLAAARASSNQRPSLAQQAHAFAGRSLPFSFARPASSAFRPSSLTGSGPAPPARGAHHARRHTRRPSEMVGSSVLATDITLDSEGDAKLARALHAAAAAAAAAEAAHATAVPSAISAPDSTAADAAPQRGVLRTPLDDVPALFSPESLHALNAEAPFLADIATLIESLTHLTTESDVELYAAAKHEAPRPGAFATVLPNVSAGWTGRRKQAVSEMMLQLQNITAKLLVDPPALPHAQQLAAPTGSLLGPVNPLSNLRREFLGSREILSLIQQCSALPPSAHPAADGSPPATLSALAPALLALAKDYQNRLLEFQVMDEVRFEVERAAPPPLPLSAAAKRAAEAATAAAARTEAKQLWHARKMSASGAVSPHVRKRSSSVSNAASLLRGGSGHARRPSAAVSGRKPSISLAAGQPLMPALAASGASEVAAGVVVAPPAAAAPAPSSKWLRLERQGNLDMYLPWALVRRETHLFAPEIQELSKLFWRVGFVQEDGSVIRGDERTRMHMHMQMQQQGPGQGVHHKRLHSRQDSSAEAPLPSDGGLLLGMPRKVYMHLFSLVHFVLKPSYLPSYAQQVVAADWLADLHMQSRPRDAARTLMTLPQFHLGLFNLVDVWTEGVQLDEYVSFLRNLFVFITEEIPASEQSAPQSFDLEAGVSDLSDGMVDPATLSLALPPLGNVFRRRLRPLNITNINNLRRLGLRALMPQLPGGAEGPGFASLTPEIQKEVEEKAREAASQTASNLSRMAAGSVEGLGSDAFSRVSSTASLLSGFAAQQRGDEPEEYRPSQLSLSRNIELSSLIHAAPVAPTTPAGTEAAVVSPASHHRRPSLSAALAQPGQGGHYRHVSSASSASASSVDSAATGVLVSSRSRRTPSHSSGPQPSWVTLADLHAPAKATVTVVPAALSIPSLGSPTGKAQEQDEEQSDEEDSPDAGVGTIVEEDEDGGATAAVLAEADAAVIVPDAVAPPKLISGRSKHPSKQKKTGTGALSWRRASNDAHSLENERAMAESFRNMALEFEEIKARARRARLEGHAGSKRTGSIDEEDEEDDEDDEAAAARRKKRASGKLKAKAAAAAVAEEKEQDQGPKFSPFANGLPPEDDNDGVAATVKRKPRPPSAAALAAAAFEAQRTAFQRESAEYLRRVTRLQFEAQSTIRVPAVSWHTRTPSRLPTEPHPPLSFEQTGVSATSVELKQLIQKQINQMPSTARQPSQPAFSGAQSAPVTPGQERFRPRSAAAAWSAASAAAAANSTLTHGSSVMSPPPPFRMLLSPHAPLADARDRPWRVMPQARQLDAHVARMESAGRRPASASAHRPTQHCDCYYCVEKFADRSVPATNTAHLRAAEVHHLLRREAAAPNRGANFIAQLAMQ